MSADENTYQAADDTETVRLNGCPLILPQQRRNLVLFACCTGLQYLAAPVLYVGITQASLCDRLEAGAKLANLPSTFFFAMTAVPALIAWLFPCVSYLKLNLVVCYSVTSGMLAIMAVALIVPLPDNVRIACVILQGAVSGIAILAAIAFLWEEIGQGTEESRRGWALILAFGAGPILAVIDSLRSQLLLSGEMGGWKIKGLDGLSLEFCQPVRSRSARDGAGRISLQPVLHSTAGSRGRSGTVFESG